MSRTAAMTACGALACCVLAVTSLAAWNPGHYVAAQKLATGHPGLPLVIALGLVIAALAMSRLGSTAKTLALTTAGVLWALVFAGTALVAVGDALGGTLEEKKVVRTERVRSADGRFELVSTGVYLLDWNDHKYGYTVALRSRAGLLSQRVTVFSFPPAEHEGRTGPGSMGFTGPASFQIDGRHYTFDRDRLSVHRR